MYSLYNVVTKSDLILSSCYSFAYGVRSISLSVYYRVFNVRSSGLSSERPSCSTAADAPLPLLLSKADSEMVLTTLRYTSCSLRPAPGLHTRTYLQRMIDRLGFISQETAS